MIQNTYKTFESLIKYAMSSTTTEINQVDHDSLTSMYLETLTPREKKAYHIAKEHLGMSFNLKKSNGYLHWLKSREETSNQK